MMLGFLYADGEGVPQDNVEAYKWFESAAAHGDNNALAARKNLEAEMTQAQIVEAQRRSAKLPR
jgi:uncharacterized protein